MPLSALCARPACVFEMSEVRMAERGPVLLLGCLTAEEEKVKWEGQPSRVRDMSIP